MQILLLCILLVELIKNNKTDLFKKLVDKNDISLKDLDFVFKKKFKLTTEQSKFIIHQESDLDSPINDDHLVPKRRCIAYFGLIDLAQLYSCDKSFLQYLLLKKTPVSDINFKFPETVSEGEPFSLQLKYSEAYQPILKMYRAIQDSGKNIIDGKKSKFWNIPMMEVFSEYEEQALELFEFIKEYTQKMVELFAAAHADVDSLEGKKPAIEDENSTISDQTPWRILPYFIHFIELTIELGVNPSDEKNIEQKKWQESNADLILTIVDYTTIADQNLAETLREKAKKWKKERFYVQEGPFQALPELQKASSFFELTQPATENNSALVPYRPK